MEKRKLYKSEDYMWELECNVFLHSNLANISICYGGEIENPDLDVIEFEGEDEDSSEAFTELYTLSVCEIEEWIKKIREIVVNSPYWSDKNE
jgi:hypothetical protein